VGLLTKLSRLRGVLQKSTDKAAQRKFLGGKSRVAGKDETPRLLYKNSKKSSVLQNEKLSRFEHD